MAGKTQSECIAAAGRISSLVPLGQNDDRSLRTAVYCQAMRELGAYDDASVAERSFGPVSEAE